MKKETVRARTVRIGDVYQGKRVTEIAIGRGGFEIKRENEAPENGALVFVRLEEGTAWTKNVHKDGRVVQSQDRINTSTTWFWDSAMIEVERE